MSHSRISRTTLVPNLRLTGVGALVAGMLLSSCGPVTSWGTRKVENQLVSYRHRSDVPWGAVPVVPKDTASTVIQLSLQGAGAAWNEEDQGSVATWSPSKLQGSGELSLVTHVFRLGMGASAGAEPSVWGSIGLMQRRGEKMNVFADFAAGASMRKTSAQVRTIQTWSVATETAGKYNVTIDTFQTGIVDEKWRSFSRFTCGLLPTASGPWATLQLIPVWYLVEWPQGFEQTIQIRSVSDSAVVQDARSHALDGSRKQETAMLVGVGAGWMHRMGDKTLTVGGRYSANDLRRFDILAQFTSEF